MITAVDTNVLLDVFAGNQEFSRASADKLRICLREGALVVCELVLAELAAAFEKPGDMISAIEDLGIDFAPSSKEAAVKAGETWKRYRKAGGTRARMIADFLIGAHAAVQCDRLLTRDRGFYKSYFKELTIMDPGAA